MTALQPSYSGRIDRSEFFLFIVAWKLVVLVFLGVAASIGGEAASLLFNLFFFLSLFYPLGFIIRRLHDLNISGICFFLILIPVINFFFLLFLLCAPGTDGVNKYGEKPSLSNQPSRSSTKSENPPLGQKQETDLTDTVKSEVQDSEEIIKPEKEKALSDLSDPPPLSLYQKNNFQKIEAAETTPSAAKESKKKKKIVFAVILFFFAAVGIFSLGNFQKSGLTGFDRYSWGTSLQEMKEKEDLFLWYKLSSNEQIYISLKNLPPNSSNFPSPAHYYIFQDDKFTQVIISYPKDKKDLFLQKVSNARKEWGAPTQSTSSKGLSCLSYSFPKSLIYLSDPNNNLEEYLISYSDTNLIDSKDMLLVLNELTTSAESPEYKSDPRGFQGFPWGTSVEEIAKQRDLEPLQDNSDANLIYTSYWDATNYNLQKKGKISPYIVYYFYKNQLVSGDLLYSPERKEEYLQEQNRLAFKFGAPAQNIEAKDSYVAYHFHTTDIQFYNLSPGYSITFVDLEHNRKERVSELKKQKTNQNP